MNPGYQCGSELKHGITAGILNGVSSFVGSYTCSSDAVALINLRAETQYLARGS